MPFAMDSNSSQAYFGEEATLGVQSPGPFYPLEPNSYSTWGVDTKTVQRETLNISRQQQKGTITERDVAAGFMSDYTQNNLARLFQGFFFADVADKPSTVPTNAAPVAVSAVSATQFTLASVVAFKPQHILFAKGFTHSVNNGAMLASAVAGAVVTAGGLHGGATVAEGAPPAAASLTAVGFQLSAGATLAGLTSGPLVLTDGGGVDFTTLGFNAGEWLYLGDVGNAVAGSNFNFTGATSGLTLRGYARIAPGGIAATTLTFDFTTMTTGSDATASTTAGVNIWFGSYLFNQNTLATIKRRSYTLPRYLGKGVGSADQLEVMLGCVPDKLTLNVGTATKVTADLTFVGINSEYNNTTMLTGTIAPPFAEAAINTSADIFASLLTVNGTESSSLFAYATDGKIEFDNGASVARALGTATGFDIMVGDFKVSITATVYFDDINALEAVQNNADVGYTTIFAARNAGSIFDVPLLTMGGGQLKLEKDKKIMVDLTGAGSEAAANYTASHTRFPYLPNSAVSGYTGL
jgi:hypothetical protein